MGKFFLRYVPLTFQDRIPRRRLGGGTGGPKHALKLRHKPLHRWKHILFDRT